MDCLLERLDAEGVVHWTFSSSEVRDGSVYPMIWDHLLSGDAEVCAYTTGRPLSERLMLAWLP